MNGLLGTVRKTLHELDQGLKGALNITDAMEALSNALALNKVPAQWEAVAYFSKKTLVEWFVDLIARVDQLKEWSSEMVAPFSLWISGLFNPMSFITAIMQVTAREQNLPLDNMVLRTDVTNNPDQSDITTHSNSGSYIHGFYLEGAAWELGRPGEQGYLTDQQPKDLHPLLPVVHITAIPSKDRVTRGYYECPVYVTSMRGPTIVFTAWLQMESEDFDDSKWILSGTCLLMSGE